MRLLFPAGASESLMGTDKSNLVRNRGSWTKKRYFLQPICGMPGKWGKIIPYWVLRAGLEIFCAPFPRRQNPGQPSSAIWPGHFSSCFWYTARSFLGSFLWTLADRIKTDHVKLGWFEIRPNDEVLVLDPQNVGESTNEFDPADIQRIERMFEFIETEANFARLNEWGGTEIGIDVDIEDFLTLPVYASERAQAFERVEGLKND